MTRPIGPDEPASGSASGGSGRGGGRPSSTASRGRKKSKKKAKKKSKKKATRKAAARKRAPRPAEPSFIERLAQLGGVTGGFAERIQRLVGETGGLPLRLGRALLPMPDSEVMRRGGATLRELREVAGLTLDELGEAIDLDDHTLLEAVENGTALLSFELTLRLAGLLARHDPLPFIMRFTRTYNPELWQMLEAWGVGRLPLQFEREREFINVYRRHDAARKLSDEGFSRVLDFTRAAFELSLHFIAEQENVEDVEQEP
jgi:transcriptional regulator with XRE-family HTH domain